MLAGAVAGVAVVAVLAFASGDDDAPADDALALLGSEARFDTSEEAVTGFASAYQLLVEEAADFERDCGDDEGKARCLGLNQAAGWALAFSPASGSCTQPSIQEGRIALRDYVKRTIELADSVDEPPPLPPIPSC